MILLKDLPECRYALDEYGTIWRRLCDGSREYLRYGDDEWEEGDDPVYDDILVVPLPSEYDLYL